MSKFLTYGGVFIAGIIIGIFLNHIVAYSGM